MKKPQPKEFAREDRRLVLAILRFSKLLLESCTNRNLYASYEQLNDLLHTRDLDVLEACLRLLLRPAQRHSAQRSARSIFTVSQDRLFALAHSWGSKELGLDLQQLADSHTAIPRKLTTINFQFYRTVSPSKPTHTSAADAPAAGTTTASSAPSGSGNVASETEPASSAPPATLGKQRRTSTSGPQMSSHSTTTTEVSTPSASLSEGVVVIQASDLGQYGASDYEILNHFIQEYQIPEEHHFQLLSRIRIATGISHPDRRQQLLIIRILAIAVMSHVLSEAVIIEKFFAFEPEIIQSLTDLIHPDHNVPYILQTVALFALDGLAHLRNKQSDVLTAINASASHGVFMYALRKIVAGLDSENAAFPQEFLDAFFALISFIIGSQTGGNMVISAGIVPVLLQILSNKHVSQLRNVTKSVTVLDSLVYGFGTAFTSFCTSGGLNSLVARIKEEVDYALILVNETEASQMSGVISSGKDEDASPVPFERTALMKAMFKFVIHMMQSPGTQEGLRNLIDTTLPGTLKAIMEKPSALGTSIYAHAINTMTSFIHNEPTSLAILQEAKIPQTLLASLSKGIPPSNDVAMNLPGAFGAICLNPVGLEMFTQEFDIKIFFDMFTSIPHVRAFQDSEIASNLGVSIDELVRHQPTLKAKVMAQIIIMLKEVLRTCESGELSKDDLKLCMLQRHRSEDAAPAGEVTWDETSKDDTKDSLVSQLIEGCARFCESFFQNTSNSNDFLKADGIDILMRFYSLPTLPYDVSNTAFFTMSHLIKLLSESNPSASMVAVIKEMNRVLQEVRPLLDSSNPSSDLVQYIDIAGSSDEDVARGNSILRSLISLTGLSGLMSDMYCAPAFSHGRNSSSVLAAFVSAHGDEALAGLGQLHRMCVWETLLLKRALQKNWDDPHSKAKKLSTTVSIPGVADERTDAPAGEDKETAASTPAFDIHSPAAINTKYFKFVLTQIPHYIAPMYHGITKMLFTRRDIESAQRANAFKVADSLSGVLQSHIAWTRIDGGSPIDKFSYLKTMLALLPFLFVDDRSPVTLQTVMVVSFVRTGGLDALFSWLDSYWATATAIQPSSETVLNADQKLVLAEVHGSIEVLLGVLQMMTSTKLLLESSHTSPLMSKDDKNRREDFFEPHEFMVDVRHAILPRIKDMWMDKRLDRCPAVISQLVIQVIINILRAAGEQKPAVSTAAPPVIVGTSTPNIFGARPLVPDATSVGILLDMGFPRSAADLALTRCGNQLERATEYLLTHPEVVAAAIYEQEREESAARAAAVAAANTNEASTESAVGSATENNPEQLSAGTSTEEGGSQSAADPSTQSSSDEHGDEHDEEDDDEDDDEDEMLRQALEMSQTVDISMTEGGSVDASHGQGSGAEGSSPTGVAPPSESTPDDGEAIDVEGDLADDEAKREEEYQAALERYKAHKEELSKARDDLRPLLVARALELAESVDGIIFYVRDLLVLLCKDKDRDNNVVEELVKDLKTFGSTLESSQASATGKMFAVRLRLFALIFSETYIQSKMEEHGIALVPLLMSILTHHIGAQPPKAENAWLPALLLTIEGFLSLTDEPKPVPDETTAEGKAAAQDDKEMTEDIVKPDDRKRLLKHSITLLGQQDLTKDIALAVFRILVRLTRHHALAKEFLDADGLQLIFSTLKPERIGIQGQQNFIVMIMRHIIEDTTTLEAVMEKEIVRWFSQPARARTGDIQSFVRHNNFLGLRDLDAFIAGTLKACKVSKYDSAFRAQQLVLGKTTAAASKPEESGDFGKGEDGTSKGKGKEKAIDDVGGSRSEQQPASAATASAMSEGSRKYSSEISETVIHFLVSELLGTRPGFSPPNPMPTVAVEAGRIVLKEGDHFVHRCFVLQCLNELVVSYPSCSIDLMNYSRRREGKESTAVASKPRTNWLAYLLNDLIPYRGTVVQSTDTELRKHSIESNFASSVLVAMCSNDDDEEEKKPFSDLVQVRRFVIDGIIRSFKDAVASTEPVEVKYGKFLSLSELSSKILGASPSATGTNVKTNEETSVNIVKIMLEKNFITTLTNVLADIDLNYPHAKILVNAVLKPLEHLTRLSLKMSKSADPGVARARRQATPLSGTGSGTASGDDAPDLYRNSSLGMFDGTNIDSEDNDESGDSAEEDEFFDGDDYEEDTASDASDLSEQELDEEDDEDEDLDDVLDRNPFHHHSREVSDDEDDQEDEDEDMEGDDDRELVEALEAELEDQEDDDEEMMEWDADSQPVVLREGEISGMLPVEDDEPHVNDVEYFVSTPQEPGHLHRLHDATAGEVADGMDDDGDEDEDEDQDEHDDEDDEDEDDEDDDIVLLDDAEGFDPVRAPGRGAPWDMTGTFIVNDQDDGMLNGAQVTYYRGRRPRMAGRRLDDRGFLWNDAGGDQGRYMYIEDDDFPLLGAPARSPFLQVSDDVITHPLLSQPRASNAGAPTDAHRRGGLRGLGHGEIITFEELMSGNASQVLGTLMNGGAIRAGHGAFRVELNRGHASALPGVEYAHPHGLASTTGGTATDSAGALTEATSTNKAGDIFSTVHEFVPFTTAQRWSQECRMMYGAAVQDKAARLTNHVINALIPAVKEEHRFKLEREAKEAEQRRKAEAERKRVAEEKRIAEEEAERIKKEEEEKVRVAEEAAAAEREATRSAEEAAARAARGETEETSATAGDSAMEVEENVPSAAAAESATGVEPTPPARRTVMIDGEMVDITDSDIDAEFLEALPEEMRREVYNDYLQSQRPAPSSTRQAAPASSSAQNINPDFLDALPQNMRAELDEIMRGSGLTMDGPAGANSSMPMFDEFTLSRLVPQLRQLYRDGGGGSSAGASSLLEDTSALLDHIPRHYPGLRASREMFASRAAASSSSATSSKTPTAPRDAIQLVDKSSLATLVRLMFLPQPLSKNILNKLLDGGADLAAVDKSFAQMSLRGKHVAKNHSHSKGKGSPPLPTPVPAAVDNVPNLVARRCFEALYYIASFNPQAALFFLNPHDNVTLKRPPGLKKGKGKDKEKIVSSKYPVVLLLDLLERPIFVENTALMEQLMTLLALLCRPLATLTKDESKDNKNEDKATTNQTATTGSATTEPSTAPLAAADSGIEGSSSAPATEGLSSAVAPSEKKDHAEEPKAAETEPPALKAPVIPDHCLQLVVRVLTAGECSSRTFQYTLSVIQNLSVLDGARDVITAELVKVAREVGSGILADIDVLSQTLEGAMSGVDVQGVALEKFSPASSKQAKLLRVLKTIDYMYSRKQAPPTPATTQVNIELAPTLDPEEADAVLPRSMREISTGTHSLSDDEVKVTQIYDSLSFYELWTKVGDTLELVRERTDMTHVATVLLPLIESFMVVCKYVGLRPSTLEKGATESKAESSSTEELFLQFTEKHSKILNIMVRNNPALMSGSFSLLVHNPKMLEFDNKRNYFTQQLHKRNPAREHYGTLQMNVRREMVFVDSFSQLQSRSGEEIKYSKLNVHFHGEEGVDAGGVTREWFQVLARQMFNPDYALFKTSAADKLTYQPNRASWVNSDHLLFFKFIGRVIGKAIYDGRLLDAYFTRSFYKHILGRPVDYRDVEAVDPEYYKSLVWMLENDITDIVEETFSVETDDFGNTKVVDLKPNGRNIPVTEQNKHEYVKYITEQKLTLAIKDQIHAFLQGFHEVIPAHLISIFNEQELELLISGLPDIDVDEWKNCTEYQNYSSSSPQIQNFWRAVRSFDQTERAKLLQFVTGTSKVPLGGFSQLQGISGVQKFQIHKDFSSTKRLPSAHTCFNQLDLPEYETYEELRQQLLTAISECSTGFAFA
ncbi:hypothetical protein BGZ70_008530 [Mortierella alpina]|uniref:HECT-type E3 ubiquitin transferase n=1 Tax=Mortierella alpina TaxID=64518 RepID=A0A9P6J5J3_MORAP|nr:hypothetical protein BGZ70_008530 [Mortierella alpina]